MQTVDNRSKVQGGLADGFKKSDSISNGTFSNYNSLTDSEVLRCNNIVLKNNNSEVRRKVW